MYLRARPLELEAEKFVVVLNKKDADELDVKPLDRVELRIGKENIMAIVNLSEHFIFEGEIGVYNRFQKEFNIRGGERIKVSRSDPPESIMFIRKKLYGKILKPEEIRMIIKDVVDQKLSSIELTAFVTSLHNHGMTMGETASLSTAMAMTGETLKLGKKQIYDKHSLGGIPGDKTSMLLVPTVAAAGLTIPKTSSRAITSPSGTADRMECLCPVELDIEEIKRVVRKTNACLVWGGAVDLAPADDMFIHVEYPLSIDPLMLPSVMSKKKAVGANYVVIDIPTGRNAKIKTTAEAEELGNKFIELGKKIGIKVSCASTFGDEPLGYAVGPALEAREVLTTSLNGKGPQDLVDKVIQLTAVLFKFARIRNPECKANDIIRSGKAKRKLLQIIEAQGGDPDIKPRDIPVGYKKLQFKSRTSGKVWWINNAAVAEIAKEAGAPKHKGAGILLHKKIGDKVEKGDILFEIFAEKSYKMRRALKAAEDLDITVVGKKLQMVLEKIPEKEKQKKYFILER